jgi:hypothetical protein
MTRVLVFVLLTACLLLIVIFKQYHVNVFESTLPPFIRRPPSNKNWDIRDLTSGIRLGSGKIFPNSTRAGATFRADMANLDGTCQLWQRRRVNLFDPGWNEYLVGVGKYFWRNGRSCSQCIHVSNPKTKRQLILVITDFCPACSDHQLDINAAASAFLAGGSPENSRPYNGGPENFDSLRVSRAECYWQRRSLMYYFSLGTTRFHWYVTIAFLTEPLSYVAVKRPGDSRLHPMTNDGFGRWVIEWNPVAPADPTRQYTMYMKGEWSSRMYTERFLIVNYTELVMTPWIGLTVMNISTRSPTFVSVYPN